MERRRGGKGERERGGKRERGREKERGRGEKEIGKLESEREKE